jgi:uncharacterized protein
VGKLLLLVIAVTVIYFLWRGFARKRDDAPPAAPETMVPCAYCGINLPRSEALEVSGRFFCSDEHRRAGSG